MGIFKNEEWGKDSFFGYYVRVKYIVQVVD